MTLNALDYAILFVVVVSTLLSLKRGLFREVVSLLVWVIAIIVSIVFYQQLAIVLEPYIESVSVRVLTARFLLFAFCIVLGSVFIGLMGHLIKATGLGHLDKGLGMVFGALRGALLVILGIMLGKAFLPLDQETWWQQAVLIPHFERLEVWVSTIAIDFKNWLLPLIMDLFK